jgi:hypothetical protein
VRYDPARVVPALKKEQAEWVTRVLREKGMLAGEAPPPEGGR